MDWECQFRGQQAIEIILRKGSIMKTNWTILAMALALGGSLLAVEAQAAAGYARNSHSEGSSGSDKEKAESIRAGVARNAHSVGEKSPACKLNPDKGPAADLNKDCSGLNCDKGLTTKGSPGSVCWGCGDFGCGRGDCWGCGYCVGWRPDCICFQPSFYPPCCDFGSEYVVFDEPASPVTLDIAPIPVPAVKIVRIVNAAKTQTTFGFTINGQAYSLEPGKTQELELTGNMVIRFDRKP